MKLVKGPWRAPGQKKAIQGSATETRELLGGAEEKVFPRQGVIDLTSRQICDFLQKVN